MKVEVLNDMIYRNSALFKLFSDSFLNKKDNKKVLELTQKKSINLSTI